LDGGHTKHEQVINLPLQALETELGDAEVYKTALRCVPGTGWQGQLGKPVAVGEVEDNEGEHLDHGVGWRREPWTEPFGTKAVPPPPKERKDTNTAVGAARAKQARAKVT
jgi:hypothetical protein